MRQKYHIQYLEALHAFMTVWALITNSSKAIEGEALEDARLTGEHTIYHVSRRKSLHVVSEASNCHSSL